ncbi:uncharacterized protein A4U43_C01F9140 [Asparagus officinalis]|uniref:E3 ubiquitin-protein ligase RMA n=1 Tax=Asparagus officinalis TaxID=4686 RepID=A0A5P1FRU4_ASPOF|nr:E3 ubiquitin-protein ligase RMA3-like [Asparagus officinalis]XP_020241501.1 E3 ubiquitin-protein ligase RMA3-like [Asparagus officinalis]ONK79699.1 uncharacterized protein A4U43_C01F9140 [Asparagus officinalis]
MEPEGTTMNLFDNSTNKSFPHQEQSRRTHLTDSSASSDTRASANTCFDCSICLDSAVDPVVTFCGHLYCWPCIYKWLKVDTTVPQQCPVCKSPVSENSLVPLYGRGSSNLTPKSKTLDIPKRPVILGDLSSVNMHRPMEGHNHHHHHHHYYPSPWSSTAGGVLGGLAIAILPLFSRNSQGGEMYLSRLSNLVTSGNSVSQRERRVEDSLHQIWAFLFCCAVFCLVFF